MLLGAEDKAQAPEILAPEIDALGYKLIVGVDTGGDVLSRRREHRNRDRIMLRTILATSAAALVVVLGPGSDGTSLQRLLPEMAHAQQASSHLGSFDLAPFAERLDALSTGLEERRTPRILLRALQMRADGHEKMQVPRGSEPWVPLPLLTSGMIFRASALL